MNLKKILGAIYMENKKKDSSLPPAKTGGPVVKTGPTAGQNRSRNSDGTWRPKRSDAGKPRK